MTTKNSVLLIIKQFPGIEYNSLLTKISNQYGSVNSARAALSRALKDMNALGLVAKRDNRFYATDKGQLVLNSEMKNKLLFKLNQSVTNPNPVSEIDSIAEQLSVLIERSKNDSDLLKAAKNAVRFSIRDIEHLSDQLAKRISQLNYLNESLSKQTASLRELDFNDSLLIEGTDQIIPTLQKLLEKNASPEIFVSSNPEFIEQLASQLSEKTRPENHVLATKQVQAVFEFVQSRLQSADSSSALPILTISFPPISMKITSTNAILTAPHSKLNELKQVG